MPGGRSPWDGNLGGGRGGGGEGAQNFISKLHRDAVDNRAGRRSTFGDTG